MPDRVGRSQGSDQAPELVPEPVKDGRCESDDCVVGKRFKTKEEAVTAAIFHMFGVRDD